MISKAQQIERLNKVKEIISLLPQCNTIGEINQITNIPTSTIQRHLNNQELLKECNLKQEEIDGIKAWLKNAKRNGLSQGGKTSQEKYNYERDEKGHYTGRK